MRSKLKIIYSIIKGRSSPNFTKLSRLMWLLLPSICIARVKFISTGIEKNYAGKFNNQ